MPSTICLFEDDQYWRFQPLVHFRTIYQLKCGIASLGEKISQSYPKAETILQCRAYLAPYLSHRFPGLSINQIYSNECLFLNGRILADPRLPKQLPITSSHDVVFVKGESLVGARLSGKNLDIVKSSLGEPMTLSHLSHLPKVEVDVKLLSYPWDLVNENGSAIIQDQEMLARRSGVKQRGKTKPYRGVHILGAKNLIVGQGTMIKPGVVLDAENGPIIIGKNVAIMPQAAIIGPAYIGDHSVVKVGAMIYGNSSIGPWSKVGGEIDGSIIHGYSNKQHSGFLGHSYLGKWVNLGADTNTSDLKNNYGTVKVTIGDTIVDSGMKFVGLFMGDHSKSAINTMFNTGTVVGVCSNIAISGFPPKFIPSFSWSTDKDRMITYEISKAIEVARIVMSRRGIELSDEEEELVKIVYEHTRNERERLGMMG